jgi:hypothetical protein
MVSDPTEGLFKTIDARREGGARGPCVHIKSPIDVEALIHCDAALPGTLAMAAHSLLHRTA